MKPTRSDKAHTFRACHERAVAFVMPNPWDAGSARILARLGFEAQATSRYRAAMTGRVDAAREVLQDGRFGDLDRSLTTPELNAFMRP